jgi:hypothetical protein
MSQAVSGAYGPPASTSRASSPARRAETPLAAVSDHADSLNTLLTLPEGIPALQQVVNTFIETTLPGYVNFRAKLSNIYRRFGLGELPDGGSDAAAVEAIAAKLRAIMDRCIKAVRSAEQERRAFS